MELAEVVRRRRMVRRYSSDPVDPAVVDRLLTHALRAPSAGFSQGWAFLVLDDPADVGRFWAAATPPARAAAPDRWLRGMRTAPVVIVPFSSEAAYRRRYAEPDKQPGHPGAGTAPADPPTAAAGPSAGSRNTPASSAPSPWAVPYWHVDAGMASLLMLLTAVDEGLGACFFGIPAERVPELRWTFGVPADLSPVGALTVGHRHPEETPGGSGTRRPRRGIADVVHRGRWHGSAEGDARPGPGSDPGPGSGPGPGSVPGLGSDPGDDATTGGPG